MRHEVGHAIAGHGNERMRQGLLAELGGMALAVALSQKPQQRMEDIIRKLPEALQYYKASRS
jgi:hypothetical protein